ncbi:MAG: signal peptidase I [Janthinobacterium lividum]
MTNPVPPPRWRRTATEIALTLFLVCVARTSLAATYYVSSGSMQPSLLIGDRMLAEPFAYGYSTASLPFGDSLPRGSRIFASLPRRGDIVVFRGPAMPGTTWVKRVVGLPGDHVQMRKGRLWLNGEEVAWRDDGAGDEEIADGSKVVAERFTETLPDGRSHPILKRWEDGPLDDTPDVTVPAGCLFVMGDNRDNSADSRVPVDQGGVGLLPLWNLQGRVDLVLASRDIAVTTGGPTSWIASIRSGRFLHPTD